MHPEAEAADHTDDPRNYVDNLNGEKNPASRIPAQVSDAAALRVVMLIRDPRGLVTSRLRNGWGHPPTLGIRSTSSAETTVLLRNWSRKLCSDTRHDLSIATSFYANTSALIVAASVLLPRFHVVRYEDLATALQQTLEGTFDFVGVRPPKEKFEKYIRNHDGSIITNEFKTKYNTVGRNGSETALAWRRELQPWMVSVINAECSDLIEAWFSDQPKFGL
mmetsp:Transcript_88180/g.176354  ORF Transcript_88180/g.176354 Transcript_88180/m.176354 type:complete len:220 (+) Transcript_88180:761-1420(+)